MTYHSPSTAVEGRALFHAAWNKVNTLFFDAARLRRADWGAQLHRFDHQIENDASAIHFFGCALSLLGEKYTRVVPQYEKVSVEADRNSEELYAYNNVFAGKVGYIGISSFDHCDIAEQVRERLEGIAHCQAFVVDLRGNGGGLLDETVNTSELFIDEGPICSMHTRTDRGLLKTSMRFARDCYMRKALEPGETVIQTERFRRLRPLVAGKPMVILVDRQTASSAELFCSILRGNAWHHGSIVVMGSRTGAKGIGQCNFDILGRMTVKISNIRFFGPDGSWFGDAAQTVDNGIIPDIALPAHAHPNLAVTEAVKHLLRYLGEDYWWTYEFRRHAA